MTKTFDEYVVEWFDNILESDKVNANELFTSMGFTSDYLDEGGSPKDYLLGLSDADSIWRRLFVENKEVEQLIVDGEFENKNTLLADIFDQAASDLRSEYDFVDELIDEMSDESDGYDNPSGFFEDLQKGGCASGMVGMFIYNYDCKKFYIDHIDSMEDFVATLEDELGEPIINDKHLPHYTFICWLCYEELAYRIARELWPNKF